MGKRMHRDMKRYTWTLLARFLRSYALLTFLMLQSSGAFSQDAIRYLADKKLFVLDTATTTYVFGVNERRELQHVYWGARLWRDEELNAVHSSGAPIDISPTAAKQEFAGSGGGLYFEPCLKITFPNGNRDLVLHYVDHEISGNTLTVTLKDIELAVVVKLHYTLYPASGILRRDARVENRTGSPLIIESAQSGTWYLPQGEHYRLRYLTGRWGGRMAVERGTC